jgi:23S rRNA (cytosine1962-C5)-methyltransferase
MSDFENRLKKNAKHRFAWAKRQNLTAFRLFDLDMPEWPVAVDWYAGAVHVMEYPSRRKLREGLEVMRAEVRRSIVAALNVTEDLVFAKTHEPKAWGEAQYDKLSSTSKTVVVEENGLKFECNLTDYLDTGLFLDHRQTRARVKAEAKGKRMLNLFAYSGSFSVYAAAGGASETVTVDLSKTYCEWAERNFDLNLLKRRTIIRDDVLAWLENTTERFDLIVLDPPSFSTSKKMARRFEVQRDHAWLVDQAVGRLNPGGTLYFSTNYLGFELDAALAPTEELTPRSIPDDFRRTVHRCWCFSA